MKKRGILFRKLTDLIARGLAYAVLGLSVGAMFWILADVFRYGCGELSFTFFLEPSKPFGMEDSGIANALLGTLLITSGAVAVALPAGLLAGIYLAEFAKGTRMGAVIRFSGNVMMGIPSILAGLFIYAIWVVPQGSFSGLAGSLSLAVIMFPLLMRNTEEILGMVPDSLRESALALGMSRMRAIVCIVCRSARNGLMTGVLLSLARVAGETAPLLFTALWSDGWPNGYFTEPTSNLPVLITEYMTNSPFEEMHRIGWAAALVVTILILILNLLCRICFREKKHV